jgi:hypothetical protein
MAKSPWYIPFPTSLILLLAVPFVIFTTGFNPDKDL